MDLCPPWVGGLLRVLLKVVATLIFQINTAVVGFRRLVDAIGTAKDTPDHRLKLHNTRQQILQLVKEKLKILSESDHETNITVALAIRNGKRPIMGNSRGFSQE